MKDPTAELLAAMAAHGLHPKQIHWDSNFHRFPGVGQKGRGDNGWIKAFVDQRGARFGDWRTKLYVKWPDKPIEGMKRLTAAEVSEKQKIADEQRKKDAVKATKTIRSLWSRAKACTAHPYLEAKEIVGAPFLRWVPDLKTGEPILLIPMFNAAGELMSLQRIWPDGTRKQMWQPGGSVGLYNTIGADRYKATKILYVCEGWATGWSIHLATECAVIVAFFDGGLTTVGQIMRDKFPKAKLIFASDNDRWSPVKREDKLVNPGVYAARTAGQECKGSVAIPEFADLEGKPTDYDDLRRREGLDAVRTWLDPRMAGRAKTIGWKAQVKAAPEPEAPPSDGKAPDKEVVTGRKNDPRTFIAAGFAAGAEWYYDLRRDRALRKSGDGWTEVNDRWATDLPFQIGERVRRRDTSRHYKDLDYSQSMAKRLFTASLYRLERDPFREWLEQLPEWDGVPALDRWLELLEPVGDIGLIRWAAANIVLLAIWRTYQPGTGCKQTVMLRGPSNGGKSSILECLMPPGSPDWFRGSLPMQRLSISPKDVVEHCKGAVVVEWSEMAGIGGGRYQVDVESLKAFLSASRDSGVRFAYRRDPEDLPRNYVIVSTANRNVTLPNDRALLNRIVPITCTATDRHDWRAEIERYMDANRERIWAEALARYHEGVTPTLPHALRGTAAASADKVRLVDPDVQAQWDEKRSTDPEWIGAWFIEWSEIRKGFSSDISSDRIRRFIESKGWTYSRPRRDLLPRRYGYVHPDGRPE